MKILVLSDLHLEFADWEPDEETVAAADVVVLAGDVHTGTAGIGWAQRYLQGKPTVYVAGNHEFYGGHWTKTLDELREAAAKTNIYFLENDAIVIEGVRFLGCSLWCDFEYFGADDNVRQWSMATYETGLNDCHVIEAEAPCDELMRRTLRASLVLQRHRESRTWLEARLLEPFPGPTVVVVHHAPSRRSVSPQYVDDSLTPGFIADLPDALLRRAQLWIHGHMHQSASYLVGKTRIVCNPLGYPLKNGAVENAEFDPGLVIELDQYNRLD